MQYNGDTGFIGQKGNWVVEPVIFNTEHLSPHNGSGDAVGAANLAILLVEDHADTAAALSRLLTQLGNRVEVADSLSSALHMAHANDFQLIISDIGLPDGTGLDLIASLPLHRRPKAIALSGFGMEDDIQRSRDAGFAEHLTKPVDISRLEAAIKRVCRIA